MKLPIVALAQQVSFTRGVSSHYSYSSMIVYVMTSFDIYGFLSYIDLVTDHLTCFEVYTALGIKSCLGLVNSIR